MLTSTSSPTPTPTRTQRKPQTGSACFPGTPSPAFKTGSHFFEEVSPEASLLFAPVPFFSLASYTLTVPSRVPTASKLNSVGEKSMAVTPWSVSKTHSGTSGFFKLQNATRPFAFLFLDASTVSANASLDFPSSEVTDASWAAVMPPKAPGKEELPAKKSRLPYPTASKSGALLFHETHDTVRPLVSGQTKSHRCTIAFPTLDDVGLESVRLVLSPIPPSLTASPAPPPTSPKE
mmetsp:Transcript_8292/g.31024  ORF Transcript_8292/g.31024 Transcript_8292/m.31024 type:complete len:234 (+) Transcript_8292:796-1497(+)